MEKCYIKMLLTDRKMVEWEKLEEAEQMFTIAVVMEVHQSRIHIMGQNY